MERLRALPNAPDQGGDVEEGNGAAVGPPLQAVPRGLPCAFACEGPNLPDTVASETFQESEALEGEAPPAAAEVPSSPQGTNSERNSKLVEAQMVSEMLNLEDAIPMDDDMSQHSRALHSSHQSFHEDMKDPRTKKLLLCFGGLLITILVVSIPASVVAMKVKGKASESAQKVPSPAPPVLETLAPNHPNLLLALPDYTLETMQADTDGVSPQSIGYDWVLHDPNLDNFSTEQQLQRFALAAFYYATNGPEWTIQESLPANTTVTTNGTASNQDRPTNRYLQVTAGSPKTFLRLVGSLPCHGSDPLGAESIANGCYAAASSVWLDYNTNECEWFHRKNAQRLEACHNDYSYWNLMMPVNGLKGTLPKELALLSSMESMSLIRNDLTGTVPAELFGSGLQLNELNLERNTMQRSLPETTGKLSSLEYLNIARNQPTGVLQPDWFQAWQKVRHVNLERNKLQGSLPSEIGLMSSIERIVLLGNKFTGTLPSELYSLSTLQFLNVVKNEFSETLPGPLMTGLENIVVFGVEYNNLKGTLPTEMGMMSTIESIAVHYNHFTGTIPTELGRLQRLSYLSLGNSFFSSTLPSELGLMNLNLTFSVKDNLQIFGTIPTELGAIPIKHVYLQNTSLTGTIPPLWCNFSKVLFFDCSDNLCGCSSCPCTSTGNRTFL